ncbi:MAG: L,D-transpeptidase family protein [Planctomycetota bacterium]
MARYLYSPYRKRRRKQRAIYIISALIIIAAVTVRIYGYHPFGKNRDQASANTMQTNTANQTKPLPALLPEPELSETIAQPSSKPNKKVAERIKESLACINAKPAQIIQARDILNEVLPKHMSQEQQAFVKNQLSKLADKWLFSRTIYSQDNLCDRYKVKHGDMLSKIAKQFMVPYEILMEINHISRPQALQAGETIKVINGPFHARVYRSTFTMDLYLQDTFIRSFPVGLGRPGKETPTGLWRVKPNGKLIKPTWVDPNGKLHEPGEPDYPLGSRWIGLEGIKGDAEGRTGFAIHGTKNPKQIGTADSEGCIRLHNGDVILMYNLLFPGLSRVQVVE